MDLGFKLLNKLKTKKEEINKLAPTDSWSIIRMSKDADHVIYINIKRLSSIEGIILIDMIDLTIV